MNSFLLNHGQNSSQLCWFIPFLYGFLKLSAWRKNGDLNNLPVKNQLSGVTNGILNCFTTVSQLVKPCGLGNRPQIAKTNFCVINVESSATSARSSRQKKIWNRNCHPAMAPRPLPQTWPSPSPPLAHYNGTLQWQHVHSPKVGCHPPLH